MTELSLRTKWHVTWRLHVISARCVARDLHAIAPRPLESTCWRQLMVLWGDCKKSRIAPLNAIIIITCFQPSTCTHHHLLTDWLTTCFQPSTCTHHHLLTDWLTTCFQPSTCTHRHLLTGWLTDWLPASNPPPAHIVIYWLADWLITYFKPSTCRYHHLLIDWLTDFLLPTLHLQTSSFTDWLTDSLKLILLQLQQSLTGWLSTSSQSLAIIANGHDWSPACNLSPSVEIIDWSINW